MDHDFAKQSLPNDDSILASALDNLKFGWLVAVLLAVVAAEVWQHVKLIT